MGWHDWVRFRDIDDLEARDPARIEWACRTILPVLERYFRAEVRGTDRIPGGAALYVGNHNSLAMTPDSFLFAGAVCRDRGVDEVPYGLGHEVIIGLPIINQIIVPVGAVRASHQHALDLFARGRKVMVYPGSDYDAGRSWFDRDRICFGGRRGYLRLALAAGVPIVPVVAAGAQQTLMLLTDGQWLARLLRADRWMRLKVWPMGFALPWGFMPAPLPFWPWPSRILIEILEPIRFERSGPQASADEAYVEASALRVESTMQAALTRLAAERRAR